MGYGAARLIRTVITLRPDPKSDPTDWINTLLPSPILSRSREVGSHWEIILTDPAAVIDAGTADALAAGLMGVYGVAFTYEVREYEA